MFRAIVVMVSAIRVCSGWATAGIPLPAALAADPRIQAHNPSQPHWLLSDASLPRGLTESIPSFDSASAVWLTLPTQAQLVPAAMEDRSIVYYHADHLGSPNVMTDRHGAVVQEVAYFPFGEVRYSHEPRGFGRQPYGYTGKEQDTESDLHYFEARYLAGRLSRFMSPDPKFANPGALDEDDLSSYLTEPQKSNLYSYALNNPVRYTDPSGLDQEAAELAAIRQTLTNAGVGADTAVAANVKPSSPSQGTGIASMLRDMPPLKGIDAKALMYADMEVAEAGIGGPFLAVGRFIAKQFTRGGSSAVKAEAEAVVSTTARAAPRAQTLTGVRPFTAETAGPGYATRVQSTNLRNTYSGVVEPATAGQVTLQQTLNVRVLKQQWNAPAKLPKQ